MRAHVIGGDKDGFSSSLGGRPLSSVSTSASTSAGPTPSPDSRPISSVSRPISVVDTVAPPQWPRIDENTADGEEEIEQSVSPQVAPAENASQTQNSSKATRFKVFIGGIPQDLEQEEVRSVLNEYAPVKKSWLQRHKESAPGAIQKHRGFGFAILADAAAVDRLLGGKISRFLPLGDGRRIEVKRAVSNLDMQRAAEAETPVGPRQSPQLGNKQPLSAGPMGGSKQGMGGSSLPPNGPPGTWPADPRQSSQQGGWMTPEPGSKLVSSNKIGSPSRMSPMSPAPVLSPSSAPWVPNQAPTPPPMMAAVSFPDGRVVSAMVPQPQAAGPGSVVLPVGAAITAMPCGTMAPRTPGPQNTQQPPNAAATQSGTAPQACQAMAGPGTGGSRPPLQAIPNGTVAGWQQVQVATPWCGMPWAIDHMRGGTAAYVAAVQKGPAQSGATPGPYPSAPANFQAQWQALQHQAQQAQQPQQQQQMLPSQAEKQQQLMQHAQQQQLMLQPQAEQQQQLMQHAQQQQQLIMPSQAEQQQQLVQQLPQQPQEQLQQRQALPQQSSQQGQGAACHTLQNMNMNPEELEEFLLKAMPDHYDE